MIYFLVLLGLPQTMLPTLPQDMLPPAELLKTCPCSGLCSCGCNDGRPCSCPPPTVHDMLREIKQYHDAGKVTPRVIESWRTAPRRTVPRGG